MSGNAGEVRIKLALDVSDLKSQLRDAQTEISGGQGIKVPLTFKVDAAEATSLATSLASRMGTQERRIPVKFKIDSDSAKDVKKQFENLSVTVQVDAEMKGSASSVAKKFNTFIDNVSPKPVKVPVEFVSNHRTVASRNAVKAVFGVPKRIDATQKGKEAVEAAEGRWRGGPVSPNKPYVVGERGPELFVPTGAGGRIIPARHPGGFVHPHPHPAGMYPRTGMSGVPQRALEERMGRVRAGASPPYVAPDPAFQTERDWQQEQVLARRRLQEMSAASRPQDYSDPDTNVHRVRQERIAQYGATAKPIQILPKKRVLRPRGTAASLAIPPGGRGLEPPDETIGQVNYGLVGEDDEYLVTEHPTIGALEREVKRRGRRRTITGEAPTIASSYGTAETEVDEPMDAWLGRTASARSPRAKLPPHLPKGERMPLHLRRWRARQTMADIGKYRSRSLRRYQEDIELANTPGYDELLGSASHPGSRRSEKTGVLNVPERGYYDPIYDASDPTRGALKRELDAYTGTKGKSRIEGGDFDISSEVLMEKDLDETLSGFRDEKSAERRMNRELWNRARGSQNLAVYQEGQDDLAAMQHMVSREDKGRIALKNLYKNIEDWLYNKEIKRLNSDPYYRDVLKGPELELRPDVRNPWQYANLVPELRRSGIPSMLKDMMSVLDASTEPLTKDSVENLAQMVTMGKESVPSFVLGQAVAEEASDQAWKSLTPEAKRQSTQQDVRQYKAMLKSIDVARNQLATVAKYSPVAGGKARAFGQQVGTDSAEYKEAISELKAKRDAVTDADRKMRRWTKRRRVGKLAFGAFRDALSSKRGLRRQVMDDRGKPVFDEAGMPVLEEEGYIESGVVEASGAVRSEARSLYANARIPQIDAMVSDIESEDKALAKSLGIKRGSDEWHQWHKENMGQGQPGYMWRYREELKSQRADLNAAYVKKADPSRAMGGTTFWNALRYNEIDPVKVSLLKKGFDRHSLTWNANEVKRRMVADEMYEPDKRALGGIMSAAVTGLGRGMTALSDGVFGLLGANALSPVRAAVNRTGEAFSNVFTAGPMNIGANIFGQDMQPNREPWSVAGGGMISARQTAPHHSSGKLPPLAAAPGAVLVGERGPEQFLAAARGMTVGQHGPEVIVPSAAGVITPNHWDGDPDQIPGADAKGFLRRNLPWVGATAAMAGMHAGGPINLGRRLGMVTPPGGGTGAHAHGDYNRLYGYFDNGQWTWVDLTAGALPAGAAGPPAPPQPLSPADIAARGPAHIGSTGAHGGPMPRRFSGSPPQSAGPIVNLGSGRQPPTFRRNSPTASMVPPTATRGAPAVAEPIRQASFISAQNEMRDLQQRIETVRIQASDALQLTPVRALSVSLGQQFQERFGGRQQIRQRESVARQRANEAGRVANRLSTQVAKADEREEQVRALRMRNQLIMSRGGTLTTEQRDEMRLAQLQKREARRGADALRPEAERLTIRAEVLERGEQRLINEVRNRQRATGMQERVFVGNRRTVNQATGQVTETPQYISRESMIRRQAAALRQQGTDTGGILQRGNVLRAQGMGLVGIVGGTMLFTRAVQTSAMAFDLLGKALDPLLDAWTNFTTTTNQVADELAKSVQSAGGPGGVSGALAQLGIDSSMFPGLTRRATASAASRNMEQFQDITRAEQNLQQRPNEALRGVTLGLNNGLFSGVPILGELLGWIGQEQGFAERAVGLVGKVPDVGSTPGIELAPGWEIPGGLVGKFEELMNVGATDEQGNPRVFGEDQHQDSVGQVLDDWFGSDTMFG